MGAKFIEMVSELQFERFNIHLQELARKKTPCGIFFGFVVVPSEVLKNIQYFSDKGINISCVIVLADVQANALRKFIDVPVITLEDFNHFGEETFPVKPQEVFIIELIKDRSFFPYFVRYGIECTTMFCANWQNEYFFFMMKHLPELYSVYEMLGSDKSKKFFRTFIKGRLTGKISNYRFADEPQYFLEGFTPTAGDIAIDGGAYDGATALAFAKYGAKVFAFEMNADNYKNCQNRLNVSGGV